MTTRPELQGDDPIELFRAWLHLAESSEPNDPNAASLATATPQGVPSVRMVLVKNIEQQGISFFTNAGSQKGCDLEANPHAALCLHWKSLRRQVRIAGPVSVLPDNITDDYFHTRSRRSQIGAAVSKQSRPLPDRSLLESQVNEFEAAHQGGDIPRPGFWKGYLVHPHAIEFWIDGPDRLHDRLLFTRDADRWTQTLLYP